MASSQLDSGVRIHVDPINEATRKCGVLTESSIEICVRSMARWVTVIDGGKFNMTT